MRLRNVRLSDEGKKWDAIKYNAFASDPPSLFDLTDSMKHLRIELQCNLDPFAQGMPKAADMVYESQIAFTLDTICPWYVKEMKQHDLRPIVNIY